MTMLEKLDRSLWPVRRAWMRFLALFSKTHCFTADVLEALSRGDGTTTFAWWWDNEDEGETYSVDDLMADIDEAVRMITLAASGKEKDARWRLVCQQVIFRCRVLASIHGKQMERIKTELEILGKTEDIRRRYLQLQQQEGKAQDILKRYERLLLELLENMYYTNIQP